jgi:hypothetical protein
VELTASGTWTTRPFFWTASAGVPYRVEKDGKVVDEGKLSARFRAASIFWPPFALIYWPMGFRFDRYDLKNPDPKKGVRSKSSTDSQGNN